MSFIHKIATEYLSSRKHLFKNKYCLCVILQDLNVVPFYVCKATLTVEVDD